MIVTIDPDVVETELASRSCRRSTTWGSEAESADKYKRLTDSAASAAT